MKKIIAILCILIFTFSIYTSFAAQSFDLDFTWVRGKTLDNFFSETTNLAKDEVMLSFDISTVNTYTLKYNLEDGTQTRVTINKRNQALDFTYGVYEWDGDGWDTDITADYIAADFSEWDFTNQAFVEPSIVPDPNVTYTINNSDGRTGKIFNIENQVVKFYWDVVRNQAYFVTTGLKKGYIHNFKIFVGTEPNLVERKNLDILRQVDFEAKATHWVDNGGLEDKKYIDKADDPTDDTGIHPGLQLQIGQFQKWDEDTRVFVPIDDVDEQENIDMTLNIKQKPLLGVVGNPPSVQYQMSLADIFDGIYGSYDALNKKYILNITKDDLSDLDASYLQWADLNYSTIYDNINLILANATIDLYEYDTEYRLSQDVNYAATYLNYSIERKNIDDTYVVIKPYDTKGTYEIYYTNSYVTNPASPSFKKWISHSTDAGSDVIYIPISILRSESGTQYYTFRIDYKITEESKKLESQLLIYDANADTSFNPPVPELKQVKDLIVVPPLVDGSIDPEKLEFTLVWENSDKIINMLEDNTKLWFELYINTLADDYIDPEVSANSQLYQIAKVIYMRKQGENIQVSETDVEADYVNLDMSKDDFEMNISFKDEDGWINFLLPDWQGQAGDITKPISGNVSQYVEGIPEGYKNDFFNPGATRVPNNYFLTMRTLYDSDSTDDESELTVSDYSVPISVYIDMKEELLNIPSNIKVETVTDSFFELNWDDVDVSSYERFMLEPIDIVVDEEHYEMFISQSKDNLEFFMNNSNVKNKLDVEAPVIPNFEYIGEFLKPAPDEITNIAMDASDISMLRDDRVLGFRIEENQVKVTNLEPNIVYYVILRTRLNMHKEPDGDLLYRYSGVSSIKSITIQKPVPLPEESEKTPPAPIDFEIIGTPKDYIEMGWRQPIITSTPGETIGYDILRIDNFPIKTEHRNPQTALSDIYTDTEYENLRVFRIRNDMLEVYDSEAESWIEDDVDELFNDAETDSKQFRDNLIAANQIYYYYVRTVRVIGGEAQSSSAWSELTITTTPIAGPINLRYNSKDYVYDAYDEVIIEFDAPITDETRIPSQYEFGIAIKGQKDDYYIETRDAGSPYDAVLETVLDTAGVGYKKYVYRISNLNSGTKYSIKVRVFDKTKGALADGRYPASNYCNKIDIRTQFNQDDFDRENKYKQYLDYFLNKANELLETGYWNLDISDDLEIKYKADMLNTKLDLLNNNIYDLEGGEDKKDADEFIYYIPSSSLEKINRDKISLRKIRGNLQVIIPPNILNDVYTDTYKEVLANIDDTEEDAEDYYIKLTLKFSTLKSVVAGNEPVSDQVEVKISIIALTKLDAAIEEDILLEYENLLTDYKNDILNEIESEFAEELDDVKFNEIIIETMESLNDDLAGIVSDVLGDYDDGDEEVKTTYVPIMIKVTDLEGSVLGYKAIGSKWEECELVKYLSEAYISSKDLTKFIFTIDNSTNVEQIDSDNAYAIINVYDRYKLKGIIALEDLKTPTNLVTSDVLEAIMLKAMLIQATNVFDKYKQEQELIASLDLTSEYPTNEQTIYNVMKLYERIMGVKIKGMYIKDYSVFEYIQDTNDKYKQSVVAANELGIIDIENFIPSEYTTYEDLFMYLYAMGQ